MRARDRDDKFESWVPRTRLGKMILERQISSIEELFMEGLKIREPEIVDILLPDLQEEVINIGLVQKQTDAGEKSQFRAIVVVGNRDGYVGAEVLEVLVLLEFLGFFQRFSRICDAGSTVNFGSD